MGLFYFIHIFLFIYVSLSVVERRKRDLFANIFLNVFTCANVVAFGIPRKEGRKIFKKEKEIKSKISNVIGRERALFCFPKRKNQVGK